LKLAIILAASLTLAAGAAAAQPYDQHRTDPPRVDQQRADSNYDRHDEHMDRHAMRHHRHRTCFYRHHHRICRWG
jgi:Ni/Co efflux regulator RcnB